MAVLLCAALLVSWPAYVQRPLLGAVDTGLMLSIPQEVAADAALAVVQVPVVLETGGQRVAGLLFSLDFDQACLRFDPADHDGDGRPDAVQFLVPPQFTPSVGFNSAESDSELDIVIVDYSLPFSVLTSGTLVTVTFGVTCLNPGDSGTVTAPVRFSKRPPPSFSNTFGRNLAGGTSDGSVLIAAGAALPGTATATPLPSTPVSTDTPAPPTPGLTATPPPTGTAPPPDGQGEATPTLSPPSSPTPSSTPMPTSMPVTPDPFQPSPTPVPEVDHPLIDAPHVRYLPLIEHH